MSFTLFSRINPLRRVLYRLARWRVGEKLGEIYPFLKGDDKVLDCGAGNCVLCEQLRLRGHEIVPLDIADLSFVDAITPVVYDGSKIPFPDNTFEVGLVVTVLHHTEDPNALLAELKRVARRIVVIEEIYGNSFQKYFTYVVDSVFNLEFFNHPRSNRTDDGWKTAFAELGFHIESARYSRSLLFLKRATYHIVKS